MASGDSMTTVSGLTKETLYTVEVAAWFTCRVHFLQTLEHIEPSKPRCVHV